MATLDFFEPPPSPTDQDVVAPTVTSFSPVAGATGVATSSNIVLSFSEPVQRGSGSILLKTATGMLLATYDAASSGNLSIAGNTLTLNPSADLAAGTSYQVEFAAGSIKDLAGNNYAGTTSYNFTTAAITTPVVVPTGSNLVVAIQASTGVTLNAVLQAATTAKLQQLFDNGTYSALSASIAIQAFSTEIKARVDANGGTGAFVAHVSAVVAAIGANTDVPGFGTGAITVATSAAGSSSASSAQFIALAGMNTTNDASTMLVVGSTAPVTATAQADNFSFNLAAARATAADTQIAINGFALAQDRLTIDSVTALGAVKLSALDGIDGIAVQPNAITTETLISFGTDANGDLITLTLIGVTDPALVNISVV
jgi:methionine-rich copper-binding protein CopC